MLLRELFEEEGKHIAFCFGRLNPPTIGHKQLLDTVAGVGGEYRIFVSQSQDAKKNPLDYATKIRFIRMMFPEHAKAVVEDTKLNTVVKVASYLYEQGYRNATFVAGSDRLEDMKKLLTDYNGVEGKAHGYYKFDLLEFQSSGDREDGAEGIAGVSASGARAAAANSDFDAFAEATGAGKHAKVLYDAVRKGMGISEGLEEGYGRYWCSTDKKWKTRKGPKQKRSVKEDSIEEIDRRGFLKGLGAAALAGAGMSAQAQEPLPVMATIKFKLPNGEVKTIKKDLGHDYDYRLDDAKRDLENLLDKKGIKNYTIHLDRYQDNDNKSTSNKDYMHKTPAVGRPEDKKDYMDKGPYTAKHSSASYMDRSKEKEFRDMGNY